MKDKERRYLKKIGVPGLSLFGYTPALAARKDMIECNKKGGVIVSKEQIQKTGGLPPLRIFELGMSLRTVGEKTMKAWLEENAVEINTIGIDIQGLIITKWQKHFGTKKMPDACTFMVSGDSKTGEPEAVEDKSHPVDMEG